MVRIEYQMNHRRILVIIRNTPKYIRFIYYRLFNIPGSSRVNGNVILLNIGSFIELKRLDTYQTKEPETIDWIEGFEEDSIFFDVGANIGLYTLFAASLKNRHIKIFSFEPESLNFAALNKNININGFSNMVNGNCIAVSNGKPRFSNLNIYNFVSGGNYSQFDEINKKGKLLHKQGVFGVSLDDLVSIYDFPIPNYIKIDVDGIELDIIKSGDKILRKGNTKSILVEFRKGESSTSIEGVKLLKNYGFDLIKRSKRSDDPNYIFSR